MKIRFIEVTSDEIENFHVIDVGSNPTLGAAPTYCTKKSAMASINYKDQIGLGFICFQLFQSVALIELGSFLKQCLHDNQPACFPISSVKAPPNG